MILSHVLCTTLHITMSFLVRCEQTLEVLNVLKEELSLQNYPQYQQVWDKVSRPEGWDEKWYSMHYSLLSLMLNSSPRREEKNETVRFFLRQGFPIESVGVSGYNLLWDYIWRGGIDVNWIRVLLTHGANPHFKPLDQDYCLVSWFDSLSDRDENELPEEAAIANILSKYMRKTLPVEIEMKARLEQITEYRESVFQAKRQLRRVFEKWITVLPLEKSEYTE